MTDTASILKSLISLAIIGIIIYLIVAFHTVFGQILHDVEQLGHTVFQAIGISLEKLDCCINSCPGDKTPCSASQIKSMKDNSGYNICSNCSGGPCYLPSFKAGISCTEWAFLGLFGFLGWLLIKIKRNNTKDVLVKSSYNIDFTAALEKENFYALQFHPEKSHKYGFEVFKNFANIQNKFK